MKLSFTIFCFSVLLTSLFSCQKEITDDLIPSGGGTVRGSFRAKIDGTQWTANKATGASRMQGFITVGGVSIDKKIISITVLDSGVHRYTLDDNSMAVGDFQDSSLADVNSFTTNGGLNPGDAGGYFEITKIDTTKKTMSGNFSFKVMRQTDNGKRTITEGVFTDISYVTSFSPNSTDTLTAKIDGSPFTGILVTGIASFGNLQLSGATATADKSLGIILPDNVVPGTYNLTTLGSYMGIYNPDATGLHTKMSKTGTVTILEHNTTTKKIRGNFNFIADELISTGVTVNVTQGYFSVKYL